MKRVRVLVLLLGLVPLLGLVLLIRLAPAGAQTVPPGGAPPSGSGPITHNGFVRVYDGDTIEVRLQGNRVLVGVIGINTPMGNTPCGRDATVQMRTLTRGGVRLEEDPTIVFDARGRRMYHARTLDGRSIALELARAGLARADGQGVESAQLAQAEAEARAAQRGCVWRGPQAPTLGPTPTVGGEATLAATAASTSLLAGFVQDTIATTPPGTTPTGFAFLPGGRILIADQSGLVWLVKDGVLQSTPFLDLRAQVNNYGDRGLLGIAADPAFAADGNGFVYVYYIFEHDAADYTGPKTGRLSRFTASGDSAALNSEQVVLGQWNGADCGAAPAGTSCLPADDISHNGGRIAVTADGSLFLFVGDASSFNYVDDRALRAQDLDSLAGKVLRVTTSGAGLPSNPFYTGDPNANRSRVWAYGLRNPFRGGLRPGENVPYIGDVGWNTWEEVNVALLNGTVGANFGWPCYEGNARQGGYEPKPICQTLYNQGAPAVRAPLTTYNHSGSGASVTGGAFYTGTAFPTEYQGAFFYGDYVRSFINYLKVDANHNLVGEPSTFANGADGPVDFAAGPDQGLYYLAINTGQLRRIRYTAPAPPPSGTSYVSDLAWTHERNGWGCVERDKSLGDLACGDGGQIRIQGQSFAKGLGAHALSDVRVYLGQTCTSFSATAGVDDEVGPNGTVVFEVWADGTKLWDSGRMTGRQGGKDVTVSLTGRDELRLYVGDAGDNIGYDHADWGGARLTCSGDTTAPTVIGTTPAAGATGVPVATTVTATFSEAMNESTITTATFTLAKQGSTTNVPATVTYNASTSTATLTPSAALDPAASYTATVEGGSTGVKDQAGNALAADKTWSFTTADTNTPPVATISAPSPALTWQVGDTITYSGSATDAEDGEIPDASLRWEIRIQHCPGGGACHVHPVTSTTGAGGSFTTEDHDDDVYYEFLLTATDSGGMTGTVTVRINPRTVSITLASSPSGRQLVYNGTSGTAPFTRAAIVGGRRTIYAPSPQGGYIFTSWSDGGTQQHDITVGETDATYTATFNPDTTPPTITNVRATSVGATTATIAWTTDEPADSQVEFGTTTAYGSLSPLDSALITDHTITLTGLRRNTTYHYRVRSRDAAGNVSVSEDQTFRTTNR